jgi:hypothetical protein
MKKQILIGLAAIVLASAGAISSASAQEQVESSVTVSQASTTQQATNDIHVAEASTPHQGKAHFWQRWNQNQKGDESTCVGPVSFCNIYAGS